MAPRRTNENETLFGKWLDRHGIDYAEAARELGVTRERVRQIAQRKYPSLVLSFVIKDWTQAVDAEDYIEVETWREVVMASNEAREIARSRAAAKVAPPAAPARPRKSKLRR